MRHLRTYENKKEPQVHRWKDWFIYLTNTNIGEIVKISIGYYSIDFKGRYHGYEFVDDIKNGDIITEVEREDIEYFGTKEEMEIQLQANKFNL